MDMERRRMALVSKLYYEDDMTQQQIAKRLEVSRMKVSRMLQKAKNEGIVKVIIDYSGVYPELEQELQEKYNLKEVIVVDTSFGGSSKEQVASAAAYYLENHLKAGATVAVGWGLTIRQIPKYLKQVSDSTLTFSPIIGGHGQTELDMHASTIASRFAKQTGSKSLSLVAPALVDSEEEKKILHESERIKDVLSCTANAEYAVFSLGNPIVKGSSISMSGYLSKENLQQLKEEDVICDVVSITFLNRDSKECCENITKRCIAITGEELKAIPNKICVVEGADKKETVKAALNAGFIDILVIDEEIAGYLLEK